MWVKSIFPVVFLGLGLTGVGCSVAFNQSSSQCHSQQDCLALGPAFAGTTCSPQRVCVPIDVSARQCNTNQDCSSANGGAPFLCRADGVCVSMLSPECPVVLGDKEDLLNDNAILIGHIAPPNIDGQAEQDVFDLARYEIKKSLGGGLPPVQKGGAARPLVIVSCTPEPFSVSGLGSIPQTQRALAHLENDLQVPIQFGPLTPATVIIGGQAAIQNQILMFASTSNPAFSNLDRTYDLTYRLAYAPPVAEAALDHFLNDYVIPQVYAQGLANTGDPIKIAMMIDDSLVYLAQGALTIVTDHPIQSFDYGNVSDTVNDPNPQPAITGDLLAMESFAPHIVLIAGGPSAVGQWMIPFAKSWPAATPFPFMIGLIANPATSIASSLSTLRPDVQQRLFFLSAFGYGFQQSDVDMLTTNLRFRSPDEQTIATNQDTVNYYDALYIAAYAIVANGSNPLTGPNLAKGVRRVADQQSGGMVVPWGPNSLPTAIAALAAGMNISYQGVSGTFPFDKNGNRAGNSHVFCIKGGNPVDSGYYVDPTTNQVTGAVTNCP